MINESVDAPFTSVTFPSVVFEAGSSVFDEEELAWEEEVELSGAEDELDSTADEEEAASSYRRRLPELELASVYELLEAPSIMELLELACSELLELLEASPSSSVGVKDVGYSLALRAMK